VFVQVTVDPTATVMGVGLNAYPDGALDWAMIQTVPEPAVQTVVPPVVSPVVPPVVPVGPEPYDEPDPPHASAVARADMQTIRCWIFISLGVRVPGFECVARLDTNLGLCGEPLTLCDQRMCMAGQERGLFALDGQCLEKIRDGTTIATPGREPSAIMEREAIVPLQGG
jgi:hypothetical protein